MLKPIGLFALVACLGGCAVAPGYGYGYDGYGDAYATGYGPYYYGYPAVYGGGIYVGGGGGYGGHYYNHWHGWNHG